MSKNFKSKNQFDPEMKRRASEGNKSPLKGDCSGLQSLLTASQWMEHADHSQKSHEENLRKAMVAGRPVSDLVEMLRLQVKGNHVPGYLAWQSSMEERVVTDETVQEVEKGTKSWAAIIRTKENKYATLLAKAGNNNDKFTYWVRDCSVETQTELKGKDELAKYVETKQVVGGNVEQVRFTSKLEIDLSLFNEVSHQDMSDDNALEEDPKRVISMAFENVSNRMDIEPMKMEKRHTFQECAAERKERSQCSSGKHEETQLENIGQLKLGDSKGKHSISLHSSQSKDNSLSEFLDKQQPRKFDVLDEQDCPSTFQEAVQGHLKETLEKDADGKLQLERRLQELSEAVNQTNESINKLVKPIGDKQVNGVTVMNKVFQKVIRTLKRPQPLMPSLESMLFNDSLTPKRQAVMSIISSTHRRQNKPQDSQEDNDEPMTEDDDDILPEEAKEYIKVIKQTNIKDVLDHNPFLEQYFMLDETTSDKDPNWITEFESQVEFRKQMNKTLKQQVLVLQQTVILLANARMRAYQQAYLQELWCLAAIELDSYMEPLDELHRHMFRQMFPDAQHFHYEQSVLGQMMLLWNRIFAEFVSELPSEAVKIYKEWSDGVVDPILKEKEYRYLRKLHFAIIDFNLTVENIKHLDQEYREDMFKGITEQREKLISLSNKGETVDRYEEIRQVIDEKLWLQIMDTHVKGDEKQNQEEESNSMEESRFKRQKYTDISELVTFKGWTPINRTIVPFILNLKQEQPEDFEQKKGDLWSEHIPKTCMTMEEVKETAAYKVFKEELFNLGDYQSYINDISVIVEQYGMLSEELKC